MQPGSPGLLAAGRLPSCPIPCCLAAYCLLVVSCLLLHNKLLPLGLLLLLEVGCLLIYLQRKSREQSNIICRQPTEANSSITTQENPSQF